MKDNKELKVENLSNVSGAGYDRNFNIKPDGDNSGRIVRERKSADCPYLTDIFTNW